MTTPDPPRPAGWFFDANLIPVGKALSSLRDDIWFPEAPGCPVDSASMPDDEWLPIIGGANYAVVTRDKRIRRRPGEMRALVDAGVQAFCLTGAGQFTRWDTARLVMRRWDDMNERCADEPGPFLYAVTAGPLREINLPT